MYFWRASCAWAAVSVEISEKVLRQKLGTDKAQMDYINQMLDEVAANNKQ